MGAKVQNNYQLSIIHRQLSIIFRNFANKLAKFLRLGKKRNEFLCFALDFS